MGFQTGFYALAEDEPSLLEMYVGLRLRKIRLIKSIAEAVEEVAPPRWTEEPELPEFFVPHGLPEETEYLGPLADSPSDAVVSPWAAAMRANRLTIKHWDVTLRLSDEVP
jgi:hypothetical protein